MLYSDGTQSGIWQNDGITFERTDPIKYEKYKTRLFTAGFSSYADAWWSSLVAQRSDEQGIYYTISTIIDPGVITITDKNSGNETFRVSLGNTIVLSDLSANKSVTISADAAATKSSLSLGTANQNFSVAAGTLSASQLFRLMVTVDNDSSDLNGDRLSLYVNNDGLYLYNSTTGSGVWRLTLPVPVSQGGTGATTAPDALSNLGVKKKTITSTTSSSGSINANLDPTRYVVLSANSTGRICIPYKASNGTATYCKVLDTSMNPVANTEVTIDVTYLDLGAGAFS
jgi:hypothetical protein